MVTPYCNLNEGNGFYSVVPVANLNTASNVAATGFAQSP